MATVVASSTPTSSSSQVEMVQIASSQSGSPTLERISSSPQSHVLQIDSAQSRRPSVELIEDKRLYNQKCVPIQKLARKGDWNAARRMIDEEKRLLKAAIENNGGTLLHVAAGANHVHFVQELVKALDVYDLELQDDNENTALCFAAVSGNLRIADILIKKNDSLPRIRGGEGMTPLYIAALHGKVHMTRYLYPHTTSIFEEDDWILMFFLCIENGLYDLALQMLERNRNLATAQNDNKEIGLHVLARKPADFSCQGRWYLQNRVFNSSENPTPVVKLVRHLWDIILNLDYTELEMRILISHPSQVIFDATKVGNFHFVAELMRSYLDLMWEVDDKNRSIIHIAVLHRHSSIFNLIHEIGSIREFIVTFEEADEKNNMLHCAAKLAPPDQLKLISGAALQMTHELLWFEEVKKIMLPSDVEKKNSNGKTPRELFAEEHKELLTKAESWIKSTATSCMLVSTLIATGVFTATFNIPGGRNNNTGTPTYLKNPAFMIFAISDATALISSSASILMFLSILVSSYAEDHYFRTLPFKLLFGLIAQLVSITSMMIAFSVSFFITYYHGLKWVPHFISVLAFLPLPLFTLVLFPLWSDIIRSSYFCMSLFRPRKQMLY